MIFTDGYTKHTELVRHEERTYWNIKCKNTSSFYEDVKWSVPYASLLVSPVLCLWLSSQQKCEIFSNLKLLQVSDYFFKTGHIHYIKICLKVLIFPFLSRIYDQTYNSISWNIILFDMFLVKFRKMEVNVLIRRFSYFMKIISRTPQFFNAPHQFFHATSSVLLSDPHFRLLGAV